IMETWNTPIYSFWHPTPSIGYEKNHCYHEFSCFKKSCKVKVRRYLDTKDAASTGNMHRHTKKCWGEDVVKLAMSMGNIDAAREALAKSPDGSITEAFLVKGLNKLTFSHRQHTEMETQAEIVQWVTESSCPYKIVEDQGFKMT
ncbi:hypothetical protein HYPSUDRAFT_143590, partial [Hypholoma sublateritium FD-334 SS-4]